MNEIEIKFNLDSPQNGGQTIEIRAENTLGIDLLYKFMLGLDGIWQVIKDFSEDSEAMWIPAKGGKYQIMVQAREKNSNKPFDYISRAEYIIGAAEDKLINSVKLDKTILKVGEKLNIDVETVKSPVVLKYWIKEKDGWEVIKDYSPDNKLSLSVRTAGNQELLVECKSLESKNNYDDFKKVDFEVLPIKGLEITDFKALSTEFLVDSELIFQVEAAYEDNRMIMYKFIKINSDGTALCLQDYSTKRMVSYVEEKCGSFRLLCLAKDMYSPKEYDDRAIINYNVKPYNPIVIQSFTSDVSSPQLTGTKVTLKAVVTGGKNLSYRFMIDGNQGEDSGYIKDNEYVWETKSPGKYKIELWVKDADYEGSYEAAAFLDFDLDEISASPVLINQVVVDKSNDIVKNDTVNVKVIAEGGTDIRYSFVVFKDGVEVERVEYGSCSWVNFTPEEAGNYELTILAKDKYSLKDYDSHKTLYFNVLEYLPAKIDYILYPSNDNYVVGDTVTFETVTRNTKETLIKYILRINGHKVEETDFINSKNYVLSPKCSGTYIVELLAKNEKSTSDFDCRKEVKIVIHDAIPVTNTKIQCDRTEIKINEAAVFSVKSEGGREVNYEFYLMEKSEWNLVQNYSRKNFYSFVPFYKGEYKLLVLCRSQYKNCAYEDYGVMEFSVN
jgi:hypothetical protein